MIRKIKPTIKIFLGPKRLTYFPVPKRPINDPIINSPTTSPDILSDT